MLNGYWYRVAGLPFVVALPEGVDVDRLLPSFRPFREEKADGRLLFRFVAGMSPDSGDETGTLIEQSESDLGNVRLYQVSDGYKLLLRYMPESPLQTMLLDFDCTSATAYLDWDDPWLGDSLCAMLRVVYSQAVLRHGGVAIHASAVALDGKAYLFLGRSGTGKSTHSQQWLKAFEGCELINDDNPTIRLTANGVTVYGTPWSGKTPCYRNVAYPVAGIVRLRQASHNRFQPCTEADAFMALVPSCSAIRVDDALCEVLYDTLEQTVSRVAVGLLDCLPNEEAAIVCRKGIDYINEQPKYILK